MTNHRRGAATLAVAALAVGALGLPAQADLPTDSLIADYDFSATTGTVLADASGNGNDGAVVGTPSWDGPGMRFTGSNHVELPDGLLAGADDVTVSVMFRPDAATLNKNIFLLNLGGSGDNATGQLFISMSGGGRVAITPTNWQNESSVAFAPAFTGDAWQHVAFVLDGTAETITLYRDGEPAGQLTGVGLSPSDLADHTMNLIGASAYTGDARFAGRISHVRIHDGALAATDVAAIAAADEAELRQDAEVVAELLAADRDALRIPARTHVDLDLPAEGEHSTITWASSDEAVLAADGSVTRPGDPAGTTVQLTATFTAKPGYAEATLTKTWGVLVLGINEAEVEADLVLPAHLTSDLPTHAGGSPITWSAVPDGWVSATGEVTLPEGDPVSVALTAVVGDVTRTADVTILPAGGELLTYPLAGGNVFLGEDLLTSADSRRSDALHLALRDDAGAWEPLNNGKAVAYARWDGDQKAAAGADWQFGAPTLFRKDDGSLGVVASANQNRDVIYVLDLDADMVAGNERRIRVADAGTPVASPRIVADADGTYKVFWHSSGTPYVTELSALDGAAASLLAVDPSSQPVPGAVGDAPAGALAEEASVVGLTPAERAAFEATYGALRNTGVESVSVTAQTWDDVELPATLRADYSDGSAKDFAVEWSQAELDVARALGAGTYEISGTVVQHDYAYPFIEERADPHIFYNPDDQHYYATGSYYEDHGGALLDATTSYGAVGLRRATTIAGLADAEEHLLRTSAVGDRWGGFFWAPEVHKINGTWYMVVGAHDYGTSGRQSGAAYTWTSATILIPFLGTAEDIAAGRMLDASYWGGDADIRPLTGAPSFDVTYFLDEDSGQGYWIMPRSAGIEIVEAVTADGAFPALSGTASRIKSIEFPFEYGVWDGSITAGNPEGTDQGIIEGPYMVRLGDWHYILYSGATVDKYYNLGVLRAPVGSDIMDPASWQAQPWSAFMSYDTADGRVGGAPHVGGGHNSVVIDEVGNPVLVYHARPHPDPHAGQAGAGGLFDPDRHTVVKPMHVRANGYLALDITAEQELDPAHRGLTAVVTVTDDDAGPEPSPSPSPSTSAPAPTPTPTPTVTVTAPAPQGDVYSVPGFHHVNGRFWYTECEPYSQTVRCRTEIWAIEAGVAKWEFNNLTYLPLMTRAQWAGNPLGNAGQWTSAGRTWRTECDTAATGRGGCRSYLLQPNGTWRFNNLVRFR